MLAFFQSNAMLNYIWQHLISVSSATLKRKEVINGFSDLMVEIFGDAGRGARSAVGMGSLPAGIPVEIEVIVEIE